MGRHAVWPPSVVRGRGAIARARGRMGRGSGARGQGSRRQIQSKPPAAPVRVRLLAGGEPGADLPGRSEAGVGVGDGALRYRDEISDGFRCEIGGDAQPSAAPLVQLAHAKALREEWVNPWEIEPIYLRAPDAQINWSTRVTR